MSELSGPADRGRMRVGDADREQAANVLREAAGQGRISMDELDERLELAYAAKTYADLTAVTHDLPQAGTALSQAGVAPAAARIGGTPRNKFSIAIMRGARFSEPEVTIQAYTLMGGIQITVPEDIEVDVSGVAFMGGFDHHAAGPGASGAPRVKIIGFAMMGGVEVRRKRLKKKQGKSVEGGLPNAIDGGARDAIED